MPWTDIEEARVQILERGVGEAQEVIDQVASQAQSRQLLLIRQRQLDLLDERVAALRDAVQALQVRMT